MQKPIIAILSPEFLANLFREALELRNEFTPPDARVLNETVRDFVARNSGPLCTLVHDSVFVESHFPIVRELLARAHGLAGAPHERLWVEKLAKKVGCEELFPIPAPCTKAFTRSQSEAFEKLRALATLHFRGADHKGVQLRTTPLLIGPSGVGKTHLVEQLGHALRLEVMRVTVGDWIVAAARVEPQTLRQLHQRLQCGKKFILQIDELDKFRGNNDSWSQAQTAEIFNVLDRRPPGATWTEADRQKLQGNVFIVGTGTWQTLWEENRAPTVGFGVTASERFDLVGRVRQSQVIPPELLNRFNSDWLILEPLGLGDFEQICAALEIGPEVLDPAAAAAEGLNYRAIENAVTAAAMKKIAAELRGSP